MSVTLPNVILRGTFAARPAANSAGSLYFASDTGKQYRDNGISWDEVTPTAGSVSSVALTMPAEFSVSGSPVTSTGTLAVTKATQNANTVFAGPTTGSAAAPTFRAVVPADLPLASSSAFGAVKVDGTSITASSGVISAAVTNPIYIVAAAAFSGGGSALTSGTSAGVSLVYCVPVIRACTAISWTVTVDAGTAGFRVWRIAAGTAVPTVANTICTADLAISSGTNLKSTSFANFTGAVAPVFAVGDIIAIQLNAAATATYAAFSLVAQ